MAINSNLTLIERLNEIQNSIGSMEEILGKGLDQPFNCSNSGARKILYSTQKDHVVPVTGCSPAYVQTGFEIRFGERSSSIIKAKDDLEVVAIIPKFSFAPKQHYFVIFKNANGRYDILERCSYEHTTEAYGYLYNNEFIDSLSPGDVIRDNSVIRKSKSFDTYGNRQDGVNLLCAYLATDKNTEDSVILSKSASKKLSTTLIRKLTIVINDNDIPLNLYGDREQYKSFPDIGEEIKNGLFCAIRRENKDQFLFTQSYNMLSDIMMSDDKFTVHGKVIDINIRSNNKDILDSFYNGQLKKYNYEVERFASDIIQEINMIEMNDPNAVLEYNLKKMKFNSERIMRNDQYIKEKNGKVFTNTILEVIVAEEVPVDIGDKVSDRYGGKGVVSFIIPDEEMPKDNLGRTIDAIINQSTCVNRENPGQLMETTVTHIGSRLINYAKTMLDTDQAIDMIIEFLSLLSVEEADSLREYLSSIDNEYREMYLNSIYNDGMVYTSLRPISDNLTLDKINEIYKHFPFIKQSYLTVPIEDSNGNIRYIQSRRPIICGEKYMFRLKQYADDKFSSTSMSATNLKNLNTRSKNSKNYKSLHSNTPVAMGNMEIDGLSHVGMEHVVTILMIHSVSPYARRLCEKMLTGDPFDIDIRLDDTSSNRNVEILNAYLKTKGERLTFSKIKKSPKPFITRDKKSFISWDKDEEEEKEEKPKSFIIRD